MTMLRRERGFEQHALECRLRGPMDAGLAVRERMLGPGAKADRPVATVSSAAPSTIAGGRSPTAISRPGASTASR